MEAHPGVTAQEEVDSEDQQHHGAQQAGQQAGLWRPAPE